MIGTKQMNLSTFIAQCIQHEFNITLEREASLMGLEKVDYLYESDTLRLIIEIELRRQDPVNNVSKCWKILETLRDTRQTVLVHFFSGKYLKTTSKYDNAIFIGSKMKEQGIADYNPILLLAEPPVGSYGKFVLDQNEKQDIRQKIAKLHEELLSSHITLAG